MDLGQNQKRQNQISNPRGKAIYNQGHVTKSYDKANVTIESNKRTSFISVKQKSTMTCLHPPETV